MYWQPVLKCKNPDCPRPTASPIRLPHRNAPKSTEPRPNWPGEGWRFTLICRDCDHWYVYHENDIEWGGFLHPADLSIWSVELQCSEPGCQSRTRWHLLDDGGMSEEELFEFVLRSDPIPFCENGHSLAVPKARLHSVHKLSSL